MCWLLSALLSGQPCCASVQRLLPNVALSAARPQPCLFHCTFYCKRTNSCRGWAHCGQLLAAICSMSYYVLVRCLPACLNGQTRCRYFTFWLQANGQNLQVLSGISGITRIDDPSKSDAAACMCAILGPSGAGLLVRAWVANMMSAHFPAPKTCYTLHASHPGAP